MDSTSKLKDYKTMTIHEVTNGQLSSNVVNTVTALSADTTFYCDEPTEASRQYVIDIAVNGTSYAIDFAGCQSETITLLGAAGGELPTLEINSRYVIMLYEVAPSQFNFTITRVEQVTL